MAVSRFSINMGESWASYRFTEPDNRNAVELLIGLRYNFGSTREST